MERSKPKTEEMVPQKGELYELKLEVPPKVPSSLLEKAMRRVMEVMGPTLLVQSVGTEEGKYAFRHPLPTESETSFETHLVTPEDLRRRVKPYNK